LILAYPFAATKLTVLAVVAWQARVPVASSLNAVVGVASADWEGGFFIIPEAVVALLDLLLVRGLAYAFLGVALLDFLPLPTARLDHIHGDRHITSVETKEANGNRRMNISSHNITIGQRVPISRNRCSCTSSRARSILLITRSLQSSNALARIGAQDFRAAMHPTKKCRPRLNFDDNLEQAVDAGRSTSARGKYSARKDRTS